MYRSPALLWGAGFRFPLEENPMRIRSVLPWTLFSIVTTASWLGCGSDDSSGNGSGGSSGSHATGGSTNGSGGGTGGSSETGGSDATGGSDGTGGDPSDD